MRNSGFTTPEQGLHSNTVFFKGIHRRRKFGLIAEGGWLH